jgi:hypothetical protein
MPIPRKEVVSKLPATWLAAGVACRDHSFKPRRRVAEFTATADFLTTPDYPCEPQVLTCQRRRRVIPIPVSVELRNVSIIARNGNRRGSGEKPHPCQTLADTMDLARELLRQAQASLTIGGDT